MATKKINDKIVGIIGGMSYHSTATYYNRINECIGNTLPYKYGRRSAKVLIYSLDMEEHNELVWHDKYKENDELILESVKRLQNGGADFYIMACNTVHDSLPYIEQYIPYSIFPCLHIADCCAMKLKENNISCVGLIGTRITMQRDFYIKRLSLHGIKVVVPKSIKDQTEIQRIILSELCVGILDNKKSKDFLLNDIIRNDLCSNQGAQGCILGCTEFELIIKPDDVADIALFDSAQVHIDATTQVLLKEKKVTDFLPKSLMKSKL